MKELKEKVVKALEKELEERMTLLTQSYNDAIESRNNDTKSSAGDKYETGRAMAQQEIDRTGLRIREIKVLQNELNILPIKQNSDTVISGSLVELDSGIYFLGLSLGKIEVDNICVYAISTYSPLGKIILNQRVGDKIILNQNYQEILNIT